MYKALTYKEILTEKNPWPGWNKGNGDVTKKDSTGTSKRSLDFIWSTVVCLWDLLSRGVASWNLYFEKIVLDAE